MNLASEKRGQLPDQSASNYQKAEEWWKTNSQVWIKNLCQISLTNRDIGYDWKFTSEQRQKIHHYYDTNKFLTELLQIDNAVSSEVYSEIKDKLLLTIEELKQQLPDLYN